MKKLLVLFILSVSCMFAAMDLNSASKNELMTIKGIGAKKALKIIEYRKYKKIYSADDLKVIKGFGERLIYNIKNDIRISSIKVKNSKK